MRQIKASGEQREVSREVKLDTTDPNERNYCEWPYHEVPKFIRLSEWCGVVKNGAGGRKPGRKKTRGKE